ncbi:murein DD-endopeptidase MepM [Haemophilus parahaemolyticus]|uniref:Murein DD-endopeptidase MepM n=2 Tax=Haemophilus parahaemolyticus TaxID=735 RepID=A0AAE6MQH7_HAEPH|nr:murein DD-endopeptidase MepM [Haemophilus parahaemolyticus]EIJ69983.1 peptidase, M23 family [Haemophilus parahaemolyticus HK385]OOR97904.1 murein DD-endopeptidase MepM [Haemophilus parahaemolyticus]QEN11778.1 murein DD-endopeptidase MepM [Haemophilus parahaemolyticus]QRP13537.1 murein DD-endopeptidase MepM [Haemophilus parahaemolyticus]STO65856.1 metalloprotease [Haemophilus parahaemolyticus HK385]
MAVLSIGIGIALSLKKQTPRNESSQENVIILDNLDNDIIDDVENPNSDTEQAEKKQDLTEDPNATSYDDELASEDDEEEGEEGKSKVLQEKLPEEAEQLISDIVNIADEALRIQDQFSYVVTKDDKLSDVLEQSGLGDDDARALIFQYPELGKLEVGQQFYWVLDNFGELEYLNWLVSEKEERIYERQEHGKFSYQRIEKKGVWRQDVVKGEIQGSFTTSLRNVGLSDRQIKQLAVGLQSQIATSKLKNGDSFAILVRREYINDTVTDIGNVEGILIESSNKRYYAIQASDGRYYSNHGETLTKGFARQPLLFTARVSSPFNPRRLHPITKRVRPHNGVDFGIPMGTPIIAPSDGVVEHVAFQAKGAGRYIKIRHGHITTVYMHLSKPLVKKGQTVRKGERIALSGNSGGSTGPHLHYEFHINGRPVNPMTVKLPGSGSGMASKDRKNFLERVKNVQAKLKL